ncbi:MAG: conjugal transfer protein TraF [Gammaproteobacteria bacterium]|nr:conjugal transfer protein TraF [Gammaproteobacteria bacterium]
MINASPSLPNFAFWVEMGKLPSIRGEYVLFDAPSNRYYDKPFVKQVSGLPGDLIENHHGDYFVNGVFTGTAKPRSKTGDLLKAGPTGVIPELHYFVTTPHKDSYDSRYADIGFVPSVLVLGTAHPIL